jgi:integrase
MASVFFYLRRGLDWYSRPENRTVKPQPETVFLAYRVGSEKLVLSTGWKVFPKHWDDEKRRVRNVVAATQKTEVNNYLDGLERFINQTADRYKANFQTLTKQALKTEVEAFLNPAPKVANRLFAFIDTVIEETESGKRLKDGQKLTFRTVQRYRTVRTRLEEFATETRRKVDFETLNIDFYNAFTDYLTNRKGYAVNNVGKYIAILKTFLHLATDRGLNQNLQFKQRAFKVVEEESDSIYLTESQLAQLADLDLTQNPRLDRVRDLFLLGAHTGLRFSDFTNIRPENIRRDEDGDTIVLVQQKTGGRVEVPVLPTVRRLFEKYQGKLPKGISNQKLNDYIKEVAELAELTAPVSKSITKGGQRLTRVLRTCDLISSHTARRSFASNAYNRGVPAISIMQITGHRTEKAFLKYIKLTAREHAKIVRQLLDVEPPQSRLRVVS